MCGKKKFLTEKKIILHNPEGRGSCWQGSGFVQVLLEEEVYRAVSGLLGLRTKYQMG